MSRYRIELAVFAIALATRLALTFRSGGLLGNYGYDPSVYYAAADGLIHGKVPYHDFVLLHPPGLMLVLAPFAALGRLTTDHAGFIAGNLAFTVLGAVNATLVVRVARRMGLPSRACLAGGLFYALWFGVVWTEYLTRLEPLGNVLALLGLLAVLRARVEPDSRWPFLAGVAFGAATMVKIWWSAPLLAILACLWWQRRSTRALLLGGAGAAASAVVIGGPFFVMAPSAMVRMVVRDQLGRPRKADLTSRLSDLTSLHELWRSAPASIALPVFVLAGCWLAFAIVRAWRVPAARVAVVLALVQLVVLFAGPSWFTFYPAFAAVGTSLVVAGSAAAPGRVRVAALAPLAYVLVIGVAVLVLLPVRPILPYPGGTFASATRRIPCVISDSPMALIELNALSRSFDAGCSDWVDLTGLTYEGPDGRKLLRDGRYLSRQRNKHWQIVLDHYFQSGQAVTLLRAHFTGVSAWLWTQIRRNPVIVRAGGYAIYRTGHSAYSAAAPQTVHW